MSRSLAESVPSRLCQQDYFVNTAITLCQQESEFLQRWYKSMCQRRVIEGHWLNLIRLLECGLKLPGNPCTHKTGHWQLLVTGYIEGDMSLFSVYWYVTPVLTDYTSPWRLEVQTMMLLFYWRTSLSSWPFDHKPRVLFWCCWLITASWSPWLLQVGCQHPGEA